MVFFTEPMKLTGLVRMIEEPSATSGPALKKTSGRHFWSAAASSVECIEGAHSQWKGLRFKVPALHGLHRIHIGFTRAEPSSSAMRECCAPLLVGFGADFCMYPCDKHWIHASERGDGVRYQMVPWASLKAGDVVDFRLTDGDSPRMQIWLNDGLKYTWENTPVQFPLIAKILAYDEGPVVEDLCWITTKIPLEERVQHLQETLHEVRLGNERLVADNVAAMQAVVQAKEQLQLGLDEAKEATQAAAEEKKHIEALLKQQWASTHEKTAVLGEVKEEKDKLEHQLQKERQDKARLEEDKEQLQAKLQEEQEVVRAIADEKAEAQLVKLEKKTANIWNLLAFILALISALALNHFVGIVRGNSD